MEQQGAPSGPSKPLKKTQVSLKGRVVVLAALGVALAAALWPQGQHVSHKAPSTASDGAGSHQEQPQQQQGGLLSCPLGYTGTSNPHVQAQQKQEEPAPDAPWGKLAAQPDGATRRLGLWTNGTIWTGADEDEVVAALLVDEDDGGVLAAGPLPEVLQHAKRLELQAQGGARTSLHDLQGRFLMPGFVDPHVHFLQAGLFLSSTQLRGAASKRAFQDAVAAHVAQLQALEQQQQQQEHEGGGKGPLLWVQGGGWDEGLWAGHALPDASWLDEVTGPDRPALLSRMDSHMAVANSAALRLAGLLPPAGAAAAAAAAAPLEVEGGVVDVDARGVPTGVLRENAIGLVARHIPPPDGKQLLAALQAASDYALSRGVTSVTCLGRAPFTGSLDTTWTDLEEVFVPAADQGLLRLRVMAFTPLQSWQRLAAWAAAHGHVHPGGRLLTGGVKAFADGSLGSRTALMWEPYADAPDGSTPAAGEAVGQQAAAAAAPEVEVEHGTRMVSVEELYRLARGADAAGLTVAVHAIGDRAVDEVLGVFERVREANRPAHAAAASGEDGAGPLHRVEHMQHVSSAAEAGARAARARVAATPNPLHLLTDGELMQRRLGPHRAGAGRSYAFRSLAEQGAPLGLASDWPVVDLHPLGSVFVSAFRRDWRSGPSKDRGAGGGGAGVPWSSSDGEALPVARALLGHTRAAARAALMADLVGTLRAGMRADFVVLGSSPLEMRPGRPLPDVVEVYVDGRCAHGCSEPAGGAGE